MSDDNKLTDFVYTKDTSFDSNETELSFTFRSTEEGFPLTTDGIEVTIWSANENDIYGNTSDIWVPFDVIKELHAKLGQYLKLVEETTDNG